MLVRTIALFCTLALLVLAASPVAGTWKVAAKGPDGTEHKLNLEIKDDAGKLSAVLLTDDGTSIPVEEMKLAGDELSFRITAETGKYAVKLTVSANSMKGKYTGESGESGVIEATR